MQITFLVLPTRIRKLVHEEVTNPWLAAALPLVRQMTRFKQRRNVAKESLQRKVAPFAPPPPPAAISIVNRSLTVKTEKARPEGMIKGMIVAIQTRRLMDIVSSIYHVRCHRGAQVDPGLGKEGESRLWIDSSPINSNYVHISVYILINLSFQIPIKFEPLCFASQET